MKFGPFPMYVQAPQNTAPAEMAITNRFHAGVPNTSQRRNTSAMSAVSAASWSVSFVVTSSSRRT